MSDKSCNIAIIGGGAAGCICAYYLLKSNCDITIFDTKPLLTTLLPTGGGRCNLAHEEYDYRELAKNYPRGEKFLYSVFSQFSTYDTIELFKEFGIEVYTQPDGRIFPEDNSAKNTRNKILEKIKLVNFVREKIKSVVPLKQDYKIISEKSEYLFNKVIIATGGHSGYEFLKELKINIINSKPSLVGLNTKEIQQNLSGTVLKNVFYQDYNGDILFTHFGISGPLAYKISSIKAFDHFPYKISFDLCKNLPNLQEVFNSNPHKTIKNIMSEFLPPKFVINLLQQLNILQDKKACLIDGKTRDLIINLIHNYTLTITGTNKGEETVTAGGIDLNEINSKTMEFKKYPNLYAIGEVLNIDGFCGGFNLQNAWSTAFISSKSILEKQSYLQAGS